MRWSITWEHAEEYGDDLLWLEGDTELDAFDLRTAMLVGMWRCIDETPAQAVELRGFSVMSAVVEEKEDAR